jgi:elongation factor P
MVLASQIRPGMAIRYEKATYKVMQAEYHPGQGKMGGQTHVRLRNLDTGTQWETSLRAELKLEEVLLEKKPMQFLYSDEGLCFFLEPESGEQAEVPEEVVGPAARFLTPDMRVAVEFLGDRTVSVQLPDYLEVKVVDTATPIHAQNDSTWKPARLESGVEVMVPQFIKNDDVIRVSLNTLKYMDRVKSNH